MSKPKPISSVRNRLLEVVIQEAPHWPERIARKLADSLALNLATDLLIDSGAPESSLPPAFRILLIEDSPTVEHVVRRVAAEAGRRFYTTSLSNFSQAGLVGMSPSDLGADIYINAGRDRRAAQHSIVLLKSLESILSKDNPCSHRQRPGTGHSLRRKRRHHLVAPAAETARRPAGIVRRKPAAFQGVLAVADLVPEGGRLKPNQANARQKTDFHKPLWFARIHSTDG